MNEKERFSTWINSRVLKRCRIQAAVEGKTQRTIIEVALTDYFDRHPIDLSDLGLDGDDDE